ncbi:TolC family protein [Halomonas sp. 328]|uniref:TolC family protein n=1 Tax=Halomonas sp. 328 TaxID=2776704 RepID=UPI0018A7A6AF|nr:TolC family protein [Halomonas sp. 328]MBF8223657.1 TolC family protein [Halomonas sp. 328]
MPRLFSPWGRLGALGLLAMLLAGGGALPAAGAAFAPAAELPSLPQLVQRAMQHDAELSRQRYELEATGQELPKARAQLNPQVSAGAVYLHQHTDNYFTDHPDYDPGNDVGNPDNEARFRGRAQDTQWQVRLQQPLFSLERWRGLDRAEAQLGVAELQLALGERDLALRVSEAYLEAYLASRRLGLLEAQRETLTLQGRQAERAYELGVGDRITLLEARSRLDQAMADTVLAENALDDALGELERLTGEQPDFDAARLGSLQTALLVPAWDEEEEWLARAPANLRVLLAREEQRLAEAEAEVRRGGHYPELHLQLSHADRHSNDPFRDSRDTQFSLHLEVPIYRGGFTSAHVRQGELQAQARRQSVTHELEQAAQGVRRHLRALGGGRRQLEALQRSIESGELFLQAAEHGERLGLRDLVDVLDARARLHEQRIRFVETAGSSLLDWLGLRAAVGELESADLERVMTLLIQLSEPAP